jgi:murein DD-endopeptidase MepM/ murein hydrolase activator NlpD
MSSGIIETIKRVALNAFEATNPVKLLFGKVVSTNPVKIQVGEYLTLTKEFLVINGSVSVGDTITLIRCQGGQKYVVLGSRVGYVENTVYIGGGETLPDGAITGSGSGSASGDWQLPFTGGYIMTAPFGEVRTGGRTHKGVDLVGQGSKLIYPVNNGTVTVGYDSGGYGNYVIVNHDNGYWSLYGHMSKVHVKSGQTVNKGTVLGVEGSTGHSTGSHLHLEIRKGSNSSANTINPLTFIQNN